jgi:hypothetical protein
VALEDIADRLIADLITQIGQCPTNAVIAPVTVLLGQANDQPLDLLLDPRPAGAPTSFRAIKLAGDKLAVPGQDGVRPGDIGHLAENLAMRFSAARYSMRASSSWSTIPVTKARMRAQSIRPPRQPIRNCLPKKS